MDCCLCWKENATLRGLVLFVILPLWFDRLTNPPNLSGQSVTSIMLFLTFSCKSMKSRMLFSLPVSGINSLCQHERHLTMSFLKLGNPVVQVSPYICTSCDVQRPAGQTMVTWFPLDEISRSNYLVLLLWRLSTSKARTLNYPRNFHLPEEESLLSSWPTAFRVCLPSWSLQNLVWPSGHACRLDFLTLEWKNRLWV